MNSIVIYASHFGNTKRIAESIAEALRTYGAAQLLSVEEAPAKIPQGTDLVVIGGPTEGHTMTPALAHYLDQLDAETLSGVATAAFDTRVRWPRWLSGSAGVGVEHRLARTGAKRIAPEESFFVKTTGNAADHSTTELEAGEFERASSWATTLAERVATVVTPRA